MRPGLDEERDIAALAADNLTFEVYPAKGAILHMPLLHEFGVYIGEIQSFLAAQPLNLTRAVASPINPVAIK